MCFSLNTHNTNLVYVHHKLAGVRKDFDGEKLLVFLFYVLVEHALVSKRLDSGQRHEDKDCGGYDNLADLDNLNGDSFQMLSSAPIHHTLSFLVARER